AGSAVAPITGGERPGQRIAPRRRQMIEVPAPHHVTRVPDRRLVERSSQPQRAQAKLSPLDSLQAEHGPQKSPAMAGRGSGAMAPAPVTTAGTGRTGGGHDAE